jgi:hypothetical protein
VCSVHNDILNTKDQIVVTNQRNVVFYYLKLLLLECMDVHTYVAQRINKHVCICKAILKIQYLYILIFKVIIINF